VADEVKEMATVQATDLSKTVRGEVIGPGSPAYEEARRIWNGAIDRRPAAIVRVTNADDVIACVLFARSHGFPIAIRGGGHNVAGSALVDGGVIVDFSNLRQVSVDPERAEVTVAPGALLGDLDEAVQQRGLIVPSGVVTHTGVAGLTLGGGIGHTMRRYGLTCDCLLGVDMVTAEGEVVRASREENAELFWGLRGGGGNFGIVTKFLFRAHPMGTQVTGGVLVHAADRAAEVLAAYRDAMASAPAELGSVVALRSAPPAPYIPASLHGRPVVLIGLFHTGRATDAERFLQPLRQFGPPLVDTIARRPFLEIQGMFDASVPHGWRYYWKSHYLPPLTDLAIETLVDRAWDKRSIRSYTLLFHMGAAVRAVTDGASAFSGREAEHAVNINGAWLDGEDADDTQWVRSFFNALRPHSTGGVYINFMGEEGPERVLAAYGAEKYGRLQRLKSAWDPENTFRANQNIMPLPKRETL